MHDGSPWTSWEREIGLSIYGIGSRVTLSLACITFRRGAAASYLSHYIIVTSFTAKAASYNNSKQCHVGLDDGA